MGLSLTSLASFPNSQMPLLSVTLPGSCQLRHLCGSQFRMMLVMEEGPSFEGVIGRHFPWSMTELARSSFLSWRLQNRNRMCIYTLRHILTSGKSLFIFVRAENKAARGPPKSWGVLSRTPLYTHTHVFHIHTRTRFSHMCTHVYAQWHTSQGAHSLHCH